MVKANSSGIEDGRLLESEGHTEDKSPATAWQKEHPGEELPEIRHRHRLPPGSRWHLCLVRFLCWTPAAVEA